MRVRDAIDADLEAVHALNEGAVPHVNSIPVKQLRWFREHAFYFRIAENESESDGLPQAFLVALTPEADYASPNFAWFVRRRTDFVYIDRVVVSPTARRRGLARRLYEDVALAAGDRATSLTCEVNLRPSNEGSLRFHAGLGFAEVGRQETEGGAKEVALMEKPLHGR